MSQERLRPMLHFTPPKGWMNDPNGLVFYKGKYHLFYQHDPDSLVWDTMHWGHAVSDDLIHWEHLPIAIYPDEMGVIYSGCCFVDEENITGFGTADDPPLLAFYTSHHMETLREMQCMAWSTDGVTFHKYEGNPIIPGKDHTPARDPQVFRNTFLGGYTLIFTRETEVAFYHSDDLVSWKSTGAFTLPEYALSGMIECPCMFRKQVQDSENHSTDKYVLMLSMDVPDSEFPKFPEEAVPHNRVMQYFVGSFDGNVFAVDEEQKEVLLVDYGSDFYAGTIFSNVEDTILMAWLGDFSEGARSVPTEKEGFRGMMCFPRKLSLQMTDNGIRLRHQFYSKGYEDHRVLTDSVITEKLGTNGLIPLTSISEV